MGLLEIVRKDITAPEPRVIRQRPGGPILQSPDEPEHGEAAWVGRINDRQIGDLICDSRVRVFHNSLPLGSKASIVEFAMDVAEPGIKRRAIFTPITPLEAVLDVE